MKHFFDSSEHGFGEGRGPGHGHGRHAGCGARFEDRGDGFRRGFGPRWGSDEQGMRGGRMGGGPGRGPGGRGGRMFGQGDLRLVVLELISAQPRHGYDVIKAIEELFGGQYAPSPGAIYPTLTLLEEQDFLVSATEEGSGKKLYTITEAGRQHLADNRVTVDGVMARMKMAARAMVGDVPPESIAQAMQTLKHALLYRRGSWSLSEVGRVARIIQDAADAIARGPSEDQPGTSTKE